MTASKKNCHQDPFLLQAGAKSTAASSLKFQAEATAHLQSTGVARTQDAPKYEDTSVEVSISLIGQGS